MTIKKGRHDAPFVTLPLNPSLLVILSVAKNLMLLRTGSVKGKCLAMTEHGLCLLCFFHPYCWVRLLESVAEDFHHTLAYREINPRTFVACPVKGTVFHVDHGIPSHCSTKITTGV